MNKNLPKYIVVSGSKKAHQPNGIYVRSYFTYEGYNSIAYEQGKYTFLVCGGNKTIKEYEKEMETKLNELRNKKLITFKS